VTTPAKVAKKVLPYADFYSEVNVSQRAEILAITEADSEWKCEGFVNMVLSKGYGAMGPPEKRGAPPRTWQAIGRSLFGEERFNRYMKAALDSRRAALPASSTST
jgi:hypothetical protein